MEKEGDGLETKKKMPRCSSNTYKRFSNYSFQNYPMKKRRKYLDTPFQIDFPYVNSKKKNSESYYEKNKH